jgi:hypothetical protein
LIQSVQELKNVASVYDSIVMKMGAEHKKSGEERIPSLPLNDSIKIMIDPALTSVLK